MHRTSDQVRRRVVLAKLAAFGIADGALGGLWLDDRFNFT